jgi:hypothetical protein
VIKSLVIAGSVVAVAASLVAPLALEAHGDAACQVGDAGMTNSLDAEQESNLAAILSVADRSGVGQAGRVIGVMTALTESSLRNLDYGDTAGPDSRGLFQQRDGWGPLAVRMDPVGAAGLFYAALVNLPGWQLMEPWEAAQSVQRSAFSDGENYRRNFDLAERLARTTPTGLSGCDPSSWSPGGQAQLPGAREAVARALALVGSHGYYQLCARLASNIWGRPQSGYSSAAEQWARMVATGNAHIRDRHPPVGALLFWSTSGPYGHVAVFVGDGRIVSNDISDRSPGEGGVYLVEITAIESQWGATYLGWSPPVYAAKAS